MRIYNLISIIGIAMLAIACSQDDIPINPSERENSAPQMTASVAQEPTTRSGVIEENDYRTGEKFYWTNGDATTVFFKNAGMTTPQQYKRADYAANVAEGVKSNKSAFNITQSEVIENGAYTAYGFFPTAAWRLNTRSGDFLSASVPTYQIQDKPNSTHLGAYMLMKAKGEVAVDGVNPISLTYKQLASVLRIVIRNKTSNSNLRLTNINVGLQSLKSIFCSQTIPQQYISDLSLVTDKSSQTPQLTLQLTGDAQLFAPKNGMNLCEGYMAVLPVEPSAFQADVEQLAIQLSFTDATKKYQMTMNMPVTPFLTGGIEAGKSYYISMAIKDSELKEINAPAYAVGDYWPDATNPQGVVFWVKPGSHGAVGKVVGLKETYVAKWGVAKDEQTFGVTGIRSTTDGNTATRSMINTHGWQDDFATSYPAFHYIHKVVNESNYYGKWFLPARDELKMLYAGCSGKVYEQITGWGAGVMPDYSSAACVAARTAFNAKLTAKGGMAFGSSNAVNWWYLSSTEFSPTQSYSFNMSEGKYSIDNKNAEGNIRWIQNFK